MDSPLALFMTWTVYGTHLQGDERGWWRPNQGHQPAQPLLADWHRDRLAYPILLLELAVLEYFRISPDRWAYGTKFRIRPSLAIATHWRRGSRGCRSLSTSVVSSESSESSNDLLDCSYDSIQDG